MTLKYQIDALTDVSTELHEFYIESDGKFVLQVEDAGSRAELNLLRDNTIAARREIEALNAKFGDIDPDAYRRMVRDEREAALIADGRIDDLIDGRTEAMKIHHARLLADLTAERDATKAQVDQMLIDTQLRQAALQAEVQPGAMEDLLLRGRHTFRVEDGKLVAYQGNAPLVGRHNAPLGVREWVGSLGRSAPHMFLQSASGDTPGGSQQQAGMGRTITRAAFDRLNPHDRREAALTRQILD